MSSKFVSVTIEGKSPGLLMNQFQMDPPKDFQKLPANEQADLAAYRVPGNKNLCIPGLNIQRAFVNGATYSKGKGRASLQKQTAACVFISPEYIDLGTSKYTIDSRPVVIGATGGRIVRHRPKLDKWKATFELEYDSELLSEEQIREIVDNTGARVGLLDFRPQKKGPFGRFIVTNWKPTK